MSTYHETPLRPFRRVLKIRFVASTSPDDEGRGRKVRYRSLFRAGPWWRSYLEPCETRVRGGGENEKKREKKMERGARDVVLVGKDARESFSGKSGHVQALSDVVNLLERSSLEESQFLGHHCFFPYLFLSFSLFCPPLVRSIDFPRVPATFDWELYWEFFVDSCDPFRRRGKGETLVSYGSKG